MLEQVLQENGLTEKEAKVYMAVLQVGEAPVANVAARARLERTTVYNMLEEMKAKGLISLTKRRGIQYMSPLAPRILIERFKQSANHAEQILPSLMEMAYSSPLKPRLRFYEGPDGMKEILREFSFSKTPAIGFTDYERMPKEMFKFIRSEIVPRRRSFKMPVRLVVPRNPTNERIQHEDKIHYGEHRLVDFPKQQSGLELILFNTNNIAFSSFTPHESFGVILDSEAIYQALKNLFLIVWNQAKPGPYPLEEIA